MALPLSTLLICYGFTVLAFFVIDIIWGTVLTGSCALIGVWFTQLVVK